MDKCGKCGSGITLIDKAASGKRGVSLCSPCLHQDNLRREKDEDAQMIKPKYPSSIRTKGLVGMLPKVEVEGEERVMEIKAGQIWKCKRFGVERLVTGVSDSYVFMGTTMLIKDLFLRDYEFVRDEHETSEPAKREPDMVNKPPHYKDESGIECKEITCHRKMPFSLGNAIKYLYRAGSKGDLLEDLKKAEWYLRVAYLNDERAPKTVEVRLLEVAAHRKTAVAGRALNAISLHEVAAAYRVVKQEVEKMESNNEG